MKKVNIHATIDEQFLKKINNESENLSGFLNQILVEYFDDKTKKKDEISELKNELSELKNQMKRIDFFSKTSLNISKTVLKSIAKNDEEVNKKYLEISEKIKDFKKSNS